MSEESVDDRLDAFYERFDAFVAATPMPQGMESPIDAIVWLMTSNGDGQPDSTVLTFRRNLQRYMYEGLRLCRDDVGFWHRASPMWTGRVHPKIYTLADVDTDEPGFCLDGDLCQRVIVTNADVEVRAHSLRLNKSVVFKFET